MPHRHHSGAQYGYQIEIPARPQEEVKYKFDYEVQVPDHKTQADYLQGLYTQVDRVALPSQDCASAPPACTCNQYSPIIQTCPVHRSQNSGEDNAEVLQFTVNNAQTRNKRSPIDNSLGNLKSKRQINLSDLSDRLNEKILELHSKKDELINKIKQKRSQRPKFDFSSWTDRADKARQEFISNVNANFQGLNRSKRDADEVEVNGANVPAEPQVSKEAFYCPSCESLKHDEKMRRMPEVLQYLPEVEQQPDKKRTRKHCEGCGSAIRDSMGCFCKGGDNYHPTQPQYYEYIEGQPVSYIPGAHHRQQQAHQQEQQGPGAQARYVFDRYGHKYLENNGNLRLVIPAHQFGPQQPEPIVGQPNLAALDRILANNREFISQVNNHPPGRMLDEPVDTARDGIHFINEIFHNPNPILSNTDGDSEDDDEDVGAAHRGDMRHQQRDVNPNQNMYHAMPAMADGNDGSTSGAHLKRSHPNENNKNEELSRAGATSDAQNKNAVDTNAWKEVEYTEMTQSDGAEMEQANAPNVSDRNAAETQTNDSETKSQTSQMKKTKTAKKYEILTIDGSSAPGDLTDEIYNIIKFIYNDGQNHDNIGRISIDNAKSKYDAEEKNSQ